MLHATDKPGHAALRRGRHSIPGQAYFLTLVTHQRIRYFSNAQVAKRAAQILDGSRLWRDNNLHAWVLMPDHAHILVSLGASERLDRLVARIKAVTAGQVNRVLERDGTFWARAYHDHALRGDQDIVQVSRYLIANPVRSGLATTPWGWPFWNARWLSSMDDLLTLGE